MVKIFAWLFVAFNLYMGGDFFLNAIGVLQTSKYSASATWIYAIVLLLMGGAGAYFCAFKGECKTALWIGAAAWVVIFLSLLGNMIFGKYN